MNRISFLSRRLITVILTLVMVIGVLSGIVPGTAIVAEAEVAPEIVFKYDSGNFEVLAGSTFTDDCLSITTGGNAYISKRISIASSSISFKTNYGTIQKIEIEGCDVWKWENADGGWDKGESTVSWEGDSESVVLSGTNVYIASFSSITVTVKKPVYKINVTGGYATVDGKKVTTALAGEEVTITAQVPSDMRFLWWESDYFIIDVLMFNPTSFTMPEKDVNVKAVFRSNTLTPITIKGGSGKWTYDGEEHSVYEASVVSGELAEGDVLDAKCSGASIIVAGSTENPIDPGYRILNSKGLDVSSYYNITAKSGVLTVLPKAVTITAQDKEFTFDGNAHSWDGYDVEGLINDDALTATIEGSITTPTESPVENVVKSYKFTSGNPRNYSITTVNGKLTMPKAVRDITIKAADAKLPYNGKDQTAKDVKITEGELYEGDELVAEGAGSAKDVSDTAEGNNPVADGYKIMHGDKDVTDFYNITTVPGTITIVPVYLKLNAPSGKWKYDGKTHSDTECTVHGLQGDDEIEVNIQGSITYPSESPVKNEITSYKFKKGKTENYIVTTANGKLEMTNSSSEITITAGSGEWTYDGQVHNNNEVTVTSGELFEGDELVATAAGSVKDVADTAEGNNPIAEGYKIMHGNVDVSDNYIITTEAGTLTINKKALTITAKDSEFTYNGTAQTYDNYAVSGLVDGESVTAVISGSITFPDESPVDNEIESYQFVTGKAGNYNVTTVDGELTMNKAEAELTLAAESGAWPYDGKAHDNKSVKIYSGTLFTGDTIVAEATGSVTNVEDTAEGNNPIAEGYKIMHGDKDVTDNYKIDTKAGTLTIIPLDATITAKSEKFVYDGASHSNSEYKVEGLINDDELTATVEGSITYPDEGTVANKVTGYEFTTGKASNYNITTVDGELKMENAAKAITITAASNEWTYDGEAHSDRNVSITDGELFEGDKLFAQAEGSVTKVDDTEEGNNVVKDDYIIIHDNVDVTANYVVTTEPGTLTINKAEATVKEEPVVNTLAETGEAQELVKAGSTDDGIMKYALGTDGQSAPAADKWSEGIPAGKDAGTYYVWFKVVGDENHNDSEAKSLTVTIQAKGTPIDPDDPDDPGKKDDPTKYSNEWVNGQWYDANGSASYKPQGAWKQNATGWWYEDEAGWYPQNCWQKIDGVWYFFKPDGYMASNEYYNGYWLNSDGSWDDKYFLSWKQNSTGWWVEDISGWWPQSQWLKIDGSWYYFDASGYMV